MVPEVSNAIFKLFLPESIYRKENRTRDQNTNEKCGSHPSTYPQQQVPQERCLNSTSHFCGLLCFIFKMTGYTSTTDLWKDKMFRRIWTHYEKNIQAFKKRKTYKPSHKQARKNLQSLVHTWFMLFHFLFRWNYAYSFWGKKMTKFVSNLSETSFPWYIMDVATVIGDITTSSVSLELE